MKSRTKTSARPGLVASALRLPILPRIRSRPILKPSPESTAKAPPDLEAFPGIDGEGATRNRATPTGGTTGGLWSTPGDGTIGNVADAIDAGRDAGDQRSVGD